MSCCDEMIAKTMITQLDRVLAENNSLLVGRSDLTRLIRKARSNAIRECAKVARNYVPLEPGPEGEDIAAAIEALGSHASTEGKE